MKVKFRFRHRVQNERRGSIQISTSHWLGTLVKAFGAEDGGADRNRTCDLLIANETLYQLSYDPMPFAPDIDTSGIETGGAQ
jgi:hypothetical protein